MSVESMQFVEMVREAYSDKTETANYKTEMCKKCGNQSVLAVSIDGKNRWICLFCGEVDVRTGA